MTYSPPGQELLDNTFSPGYTTQHSAGIKQVLKKQLHDNRPRLALPCWTAETTGGNSADLPPQFQSIFQYSYLKRKRQEKFKSFDSLTARSVLFSRMDVFLSISLSTPSPPAHLATRVCSSFPPRYLPTSGPSSLLIALPRMLSTNFSVWVSCSVWLTRKHLFEVRGSISQSWHEDFFGSDLLRRISRQKTVGSRGSSCHQRKLFYM